jgi:hypothetical protein
MFKKFPTYVQMFSLAQEKAASQQETRRLLGQVSGAFYNISGIFSLQYFFREAPAVKNQS